MKSNHKSIKLKTKQKYQEIKGTPNGLSPAYYYFGLIIAFFAFFLYLNSIKHDYVLDDYSAITINRYVQEGFAGIPKLLTVDFWHFSNMQLGYYRPLSLITFAVEYQFAGASPHVSHFINVLFFAILTSMVFLLMSRIFSQMNLLFPFTIALLFAAHPIHTEVVDNIKGRDELLSFLNTIAMLWFAIRYSDRRKPVSLVISLLFFYLALLSKESAIVGIFLLPLALYYTSKKSVSLIALNIVPYLFIIFLFFIQRRLALGPVQAAIPDDIINYPYREETIRFSTVFLLFLFSIRMLAFPYPLRYDYSFNQIPGITWINMWALLGLALLLFMLVYGFVQIRHKRITGFATGFFLISMIPMMGFILLRGGIFTERNLFAPSLGFCIALAYIMGQLTRADLKTRMPFSFSTLRSKPIFVFLVLVFTGLYSVVTVARNPVWKDSITLFTNDIKTGENSAQNQLHYGSALVMRAVNEKDITIKDQMMNEGMQATRKAMLIHPGFGDAMFRYGYAYEVKITYQRESRFADSAIYFYNKAIEYAPGQWEAYRHLGTIYEWAQMYDVASYYYNKALETNPSSLEARQKADELRATRGLDVRVNPLMRKQKSNFQF